jgi:hypothetical protein
MQRINWAHCQQPTVQKEENSTSLDYELDAIPYNQAPSHGGVLGSRGKIKCGITTHYPLLLLGKEPPDINMVSVPSDLRLKVKGLLPGWNQTPVLQRKLKRNISCLHSKVTDSMTSSSILGNGSGTTRLPSGEAHWIVRKPTSILYQELGA